MPYCPNCGIRVAKTANFCKKCGFNLKPSTVSDSTAEEDSTIAKSEKELLCPSCGKHDKVRWSVLNKSWICDNCGKSFDTPGGQVTDSRWVTPLFDEKVSHGKRKFSLGKVIVIILVLAAIGIPVWWLVPTFALDISVNPADGGVVTGVGDYHRFIDAQISAIPNECFEFTGWTGIGIDKPYYSPTTVRINDDDRQIVANFKRYCIPPSADHPYWEYFGRSPSYLSLYNNESATNPSWSQLKTFIEQDDTDKKIYDEYLFNCIDFSRIVHDNSEAAGIKAAYVEVDFINEEIGHALNVFETTDTGLVFIDCTGLEYSGSEYGKDTVAYVEVGKEYGLISLDVVEGFSYGNYERYMDEWEAYLIEAEDYFNESDAYDRAYYNCGGICTDEGWECSCQRLWSWHDDLERWRKQLIRQLDELGDPWEPGGIVEEIRIWW
jgi:ribosomal protein L37AE/L43A